VTEAAAPSEREAFFRYAARVRERTERVVARIPEERVEWTYRSGKFTLGDLVRHLAGIERFMFAENARGNPSRYPGHARELADGLPALREYFGRLHAESVAIYSTLTDEQFRGKCVTPGAASISDWKWLRLMTEHEIHHRGQIYLSLAMLDIPTPPLYGLTEEEVRARSFSPA
jgi:uncharacterized damage-inducible protein DinB